MTLSIRAVLWLLAIVLFLVAARWPAVGRTAVLPVAFAATVAAYSWPVIHG